MWLWENWQILLRVERENFAISVESSSNEVKMCKIHHNHKCGYGTLLRVEKKLFAQATRFLDYATASLEMTGNRE